MRYVINVSLCVGCIYSVLVIFPESMTMLELVISK